MKNLYESFSEKSTWITTTPSPLAKSLPFYGIEAGHFYADSEYRVERNYHDSFLMLLSISGSGIIETVDKEIRLKEGNVIVIDCHLPHAYYSDGDGWEFLWLHFNGTSPANYYGILYDSEPFATPVPGINELASLINNIISALPLSDTVSLLHNSQNIEKMLLSICENSLSGLNNRCFSSSDEAIKKAVSFMEANFSKSIDLDSLCSEINISKYHFIRTFKRVMGMPPYSYLTNYRITQAKRMLASSEMSVEEIARLAGFSDTANFISKFKAHVGETPLHYRKGHPLPV